MATPTLDLRLLAILVLPLFTLVSLMATPTLDLRLLATLARTGAPERKLTEKALASAPRVEEGAHGSLWCCRAVLKGLEPIAQQLAMRLCCADAPMLLSQVRSWCYSPDACDRALAQLAGLHVVELSRGDDGKGHQGKRRRLGSDSIALNPHFQRGLRAALESPHTTPWRPSSLKRDKNRPSAGEVDGHLHSKWDEVLKYLVEPKSSKRVGEVVKQFLVRARLIVEKGQAPGARGSQDSESQGSDSGESEEEEQGEEVDNGKRFVIGSRGYEFLLQNMKVQMWRFAEELIAPNKGPKLKHHLPAETVLRFLFQLSHCKCGEDYSVKELTEKERSLLDHFVNFGFIFRRLRSDGTASSRFYPTSVACHLIDGFKSTESDPGAAGSNLSFNLSHFETIVQTNFQVVAYTTKELHLRMLGLFCQLKAILPNAVVATITRRSLMDALEDGIGADQILGFLTANAHPRALDRKGGAVPETVRDQIRLWEKERNRISAQKGVLHTLDCSAEKFVLIAAGLEDEGLLLWQDQTTKRLVAKPLDLATDIIENTSL
mmetsp:Transcript_16915/g.39062  ORF Transcript_16915/g.39062 Transcript_16915/m.39062 type:complete len:547 (-) Transcript_16915:189-1829(-)